MQKKELNDRLLDKTNENSSNGLRGLMNQQQKEVLVVWNLKVNDDIVKYHYCIIYNSKVIKNDIYTIKSSVQNTRFYHHIRSFCNRYKKVDLKDCNINWEDITIIK